MTFPYENNSTRSGNDDFFVKEFLSMSFNINLIWVIILAINLKYSYQIIMEGESFLVRILKSNVHNGLKIWPHINNDPLGHFVDLCTFPIFEPSHPG